MLGIVKIICEVFGDPHKDMMFDSQTMQVSNSSSCKANEVKQIKVDNADVNDANSNMPDYFKSSINRVADKRASQVLRENT